MPAVLKVMKVSVNRFLVIYVGNPTRELVVHIPSVFLHEDHTSSTAVRIFSVPLVERRHHPAPGVSRRRCTFDPDGRPSVTFRIRNQGHNLHGCPQLSGRRSMTGASAGCLSPQALSASRFTPLITYIISNERVCINVPAAYEARSGVGVDSLL